MVPFWSPRNCAGFGFLSPCSKYCRQGFFNGLWDAMLPEMTVGCDSKPRGKLKCPLQWSKGSWKTLSSFWHPKIKFCGTFPLQSSGVVQFAWYQEFLAFTLSKCGSFMSILAPNSKSSSKPSDWICWVLWLVDPDPMNYPQGWSLQRLRLCCTQQCLATPTGRQRCHHSILGSPKSLASGRDPSDLPDYIFKFKVVTIHNICLNKLLKKSSTISYIISFNLQ